MSLASVAIQLGILLILYMYANLIGLVDIPAPHSHPFQMNISLTAYHEYIQYVHAYMIICILVHAYFITFQGSEHNY
jgi:hypothetical protein